MKKIFLLLFSIVLIASCSKDPLVTDVLETRGKKPKKPKKDEVQMCHLKKDGSYDVKNVKMKDVQKEIDKGSYVLDVDGDGFTAIGACSGSQDDCDDNDPDKNPVDGCEASCPCFDEVDLACGTSVCAYADGGYLSVECSGTYLTSINNVEGTYYVDFFDFATSTNCAYENITEEEYNACQALLLPVAEGHFECGGESLRIKAKELQKRVQNKASILKSPESDRE